MRPPCAPFAGVAVLSLGRPGHPRGSGVAGSHRHLARHPTLVLRDRAVRVEKWFPCQFGIIGDWQGTGATRSRPAAAWGHGCPGAPCAEVLGHLGTVGRKTRVPARGVTGLGQREGDASGDVASHFVLEGASSASRIRAQAKASASVMGWCYSLSFSWLFVLCFLLSLLMEKLET